MFNPGETVEHSFVVPFMKSEIAVAIATYRQNDHVIFEKKISKANIEDSTTQGYSVISYELTQLESLCFEDESAFTVQLNILTTSGSRHTSMEAKSSNGIQYVREVMTNA